MFSTKHHRLLIASALAVLTGCSQTPNELATSSQVQVANPAAAAVVSHIIAKHKLDASISSDGHCAIDEINNIALSDASSPSVTIKTGQSLTAGGWAVTNALEAPAKLTLLLTKIDSAETYGIEGKTGVARPDVAKAMNSDAASTSGFNIAGSLGSTPAGQYKISLLTDTADKFELCGTKREITIEN